MTGTWGSDRERLFRRVVKDEKTGCWNFPVVRGQQGYGVMKCGDGVVRKTHRVAYMLLVGPIQPGVHLHHKCENTACCNPEHLQPTVPAEHNTFLSPKNPAFKHRVKTHCKNGHPLSGENVSVETHHRSSLLTRVCIACRRDAARRWYARDGNAAKLARQRAEKRAAAR